MRYKGNPTCCFFSAPICGSAGQQLPLLYYKEGERLTELSNYLRDGNDQMVEVHMPFTAKFLDETCAISSMRADCTYFCCCHVGSPGQAIPDLSYVFCRSEYQRQS